VAAELLSDDEIARRLDGREWRREGDEIVLERKLADFGAALAFVNRVGAEAEAANHHPDIELHGWNQVRLRVTNHSAGGLTDADFALAETIDAIGAGRQGNLTPVERAPDPVDPGTVIGHVHLRTADIDRVKAFYVGVLGFDVIAEIRDIPGWGTTGDALFLSAGGYHHHLAFNTWKSKGGPPQPDGVTGLHHIAIRYPTRAGLADALRRIQGAGVPIRQTTDHGTHEAIYLTDPDGNDVELAWDRAPSVWPRDAEGHMTGGMGDDLDLADLMTELR
jgi:catechol 2,3-dioxygenase